MKYNGFEEEIVDAAIRDLKRAGLDDFVAECRFDPVRLAFVKLDEPLAQVDFERYLREARASLFGVKMRDEITGELFSPNEKFLCSIEACVDPKIPKGCAEAFRGCVVYNKVNSDFGIPSNTLMRAVQKLRLERVRDLLEAVRLRMNGQQ